MAGDRDEFKQRLIAACGITPEEWAEFEASSEHQAYLAAAEARAVLRADYFERARTYAARLSRELVLPVGARVEFDEAPLL